MHCYNLLWVLISINLVKNLSASRWHSTWILSFYFCFKLKSFFFSGLKCSMNMLKSKMKYFSLLEDNLSVRIKNQIFFTSLLFLKPYSNRSAFFFLFFYSLCLQIVDGGVRNRNIRNTRAESSADDTDEDGIESADLPVVTPNVRAERAYSPYRDSAPVDVGRDHSNENVCMFENSIRCKLRFGRLGLFNFEVKPITYIAV